MEQSTNKNSCDKMRFLVFGAGAIGTYIGGSLVLRGYPVIFLETPEAVQRIREQGMQLSLLDKVYEIPSPMVYGSLSECLSQGPFDIAVFALKSFDTQAALEEIFPYKNETPPIICLQNGVENEGKIGQVIGAERIISGTVTSAIGRRISGEIVLERLRGVGIAAQNPRSKEIQAVFNQSGLNAKLYHSAPAMKWSKLLTNLLANASSAILKMSPAEVFSDPQLFRLEIEQIREALRVMHSMRIPVVNLPGTPVRSLAFAIRWLPTSLSQPLLKKAVGGGRGAKMPSLYLDLHSGRGQSETDYLNGAIARYGANQGIATPVNRLLNEILSGMLAGEISISSYAHQPEKLIEEWRRENRRESLNR
jgi:2-dehydropantoate 2-reductase